MIRTGLLIGDRRGRILEMLADRPLSMGDLVKALKEAKLFQPNTKDFERVVREGLEGLVARGDVVGTSDGLWQLVQQDSPDRLTITLKLPRTAAKARARIKKNGDVVIKIEYV